MGALYGFSIGSAAGGLLLPGKLPTQEGPRLDDLKVQGSQYGTPIPIIYGTVALQGNIIWAADLKEVKTETESGGKGGPSQTTVNYSYFASFAVLLCEGPINGVLRIWSGPEKRLIYDGGDIESGQLRVYLGDEEQLPDPLIEAAKGVGNVPAYRGCAYIVLEDFALDKDFNRIPYLTVEVSTGNGHVPRAPVYLGESAHVAPFGGATGLVDPVTGLIWSVQHAVFASTLEVRVNSDVTKSQVASFSVPVTLFSSSDIAYVPGAQNMVVISGARFGTFTDVFVLFDADTQTLIGVVEGTYHGTGDLNAIAYDPVHATLLGFRYGARLVPNVLAAPPLSGDIQLGVSLGIEWVRQAIITPDHIIALVYGSYNVCVVHRLSDYSFVAQIPIPYIGTGQGFYDDDRNRVVIVTGSGLLVVTIVDIATASVTTHTIAAAADADTSPPLSHGLFTGAYAGGKYVFGADDGPSSGTTLYVVNPDTMESEYTFTYETGASQLLVGPLLVPRNSTKRYLFGFDNNNVKRLYFLPAGGGLTLADVVADLSERAQESRYDVSDLEADTVDGYTIARQTDARAAIDTLRPAYYFDSVESQGVIRFVKRGGATVTVIPDEDLAAHDSGGATPDPLQVTRRMEIELPRAVNVKYLLAADDYAPAARQARRLITPHSDNEQTLDLPLVLTDTKAQEVAEVALHGAWVERIPYSFATTRKYSYLEPTDLVVVRGNLMRLTGVKATPQGVLQWEAVADDTAYYAPHVVVTETPPTDKTVAIAGPTALELF